MSESKSSLKTRDLLLEICPKCNAIHTHHLVGGDGGWIIESLGAPELQCGSQIGWIPKEKITEEEQKQSVPLVPKLCDYQITPRNGTDGNIFTIRRWSFRERQNFYKLLNTYNQPATPGTMAPLKGNLNPEVMDWVILTGIVRSPMPLKEAKDLANSDLDGALMEALSSEILDFNAPPLAPSSALRQRFIRTTRSSAPTTA